QAFRPASVSTRKRFVPRSCFMLSSVREWSSAGNRKNDDASETLMPIRHPASCAALLHWIAALGGCALIGGCGTPPTECRSAEVEVTLSSMVREHFLWTVFSDASSNVDRDRLEAFTTATWVSVR